MANIWAVHSVGSSIVTFLRATYPQQIGGRVTPKCSFELMSGGQLAGDIDGTTRIGLYLYRVAVNEQSRQTPPVGGAFAQPAPLSLDLHFLLTAWAANALEEQVPFAWAMRQLHQTPMLDLAKLSPEAGWGNDEVVQVLPVDLTTEDMMGIWGRLEPTYRLSAAYVARAVRLDPDEDDADFRPVLTRPEVFGLERSEETS